MTITTKMRKWIWLLPIFWLSTPFNNALADPVFMELHCFKAATPFYEDLERDTWKPIHQKMVNSGDKLWWGVFAVVYGDKSQCDYYSLDVYSEKQFQAELNYVDVIQSLYPDKGIAAVWEKTFQDRSEMATSLWIVEDETQIVNFQWAKINWMMASDKKVDDYLNAEKNQFKPVYQKLVDDKQMGGWRLYRLLEPGGSQLKYNFMTMDLWLQSGPPPLEKAFVAVHPKSNIDGALQKMEATRERVNSQVLRLVVATDAAKQ